MDTHVIDNLKFDNLFIKCLSKCYLRYVGISFFLFLRKKETSIQNINMISIFNHQQELTILIYSNNTNLVEMLIWTLLVVHGYFTVTRFIQLNGCFIQHYICVVKWNSNNTPLWWTTQFYGNNFGFSLQTASGLARRGLTHMHHLWNKDLGVALRWRQMEGRSSGQSQPKVEGGVDL